MAEENSDCYEDSDNINDEISLLFDCHETSETKKVVLEKVVKIISL